MRSAYDDMPKLDSPMVWNRCDACGQPCTEPGRARHKACPPPGHIRCTECRSHVAIGPDLVAHYKARTELGGLSRCELVHATEEP